MPKPKVTQATLKTKDQQALMKLIDQALKGGEGPLKDIFGAFNQDAFNQGITEPALKNFQERILPMLQQQYIGQGQAHGSGMRDAQLRAGTDLQSQLANLMFQAQEAQKQNRIAGVNSQVGQNTFENIVQQPKQKTSIWDSIIPAAGTAVGGFFGGPGGAALGNALFGAATNAGAKQPNSVQVG